MSRSRTFSVILVLAAVAASATGRADAQSRPALNSAPQSRDKLCASLPSGAARAQRCRNAIKTRPDDIESHRALGQSYVAMQQYDTALVSYRDVVRLRPDDGDAHYWIGIVHELRERYAEALPEFQHAVRLDSSNAQAHWHLGIARFNTKQIDSAYLSFAEAARLDPTDVNAWGYAAAAAHVLGRHKEAVGLFNRAIEVKPTFFDDAPAPFKQAFTASLKAGGEQKATVMPNEVKPEPVALP